MSVPVQTVGTARAQRVPDPSAPPWDTELRPRRKRRGSGGRRLSPGLLPTASDGFPGSWLPRLPPRHAAKPIPLWHRAPLEGQRGPVSRRARGEGWDRRGLGWDPQSRGAGAGAAGRNALPTPPGRPRRDKTRLLSGDGCGARPAPSWGASPRHPGGVGGAGWHPLWVPGPGRVSHGRGWHRAPAARSRLEPPFQVGRVWGAAVTQGWRARHGPAPARPRPRRPHRSPHARPQPHSHSDPGADPATAVSPSQPPALSRCHPSTGQGGTRGSGGGSVRRSPAALGLSDSPRCWAAAGAAPRPGDPAGTRLPRLLQGL